MKTEQSLFIYHLVFVFFARKRVSRHVRKLRFAERFQRFGCILQSLQVKQLSSLSVLTPNINISHCYATTKENSATFIIFHHHAFSSSFIIIHHSPLHHHQNQQ